MKRYMILAVVAAMFWLPLCYAGIDEASLRQVFGSKAARDAAQGAMNSTPEFVGDARKRLEHSERFPKSDEDATRFVADYVRMYRSFYRYIHLGEPVDEEVASRVAADSAYPVVDRSMAALQVYIRRGTTDALKQYLMLWPANVRLFYKVRDSDFPTVARAIAAEAARERVLNPDAPQGTHAKWLGEALPYLCVAMYAQPNGDKSLVSDLLRDYAYWRKARIESEDLSPCGMVRVLHRASPEAEEQFVEALFMSHDSAAIRSIVSAADLRERVPAAEQAYRQAVRRFLDELKSVPEGTNGK